MNKNLKAGLIVIGVLVVLLAAGFVANAAGFTYNYANMPYSQMMRGGSWQGGMMGSYGGMMGGNYQGGMMGGSWQGGMMGGNYGPRMDFDDMPCRNSAGTEGQQSSPSCPYFNQAQ